MPDSDALDLTVTVAGTGPLGLHVDLLRDPLAPEDARLLPPPPPPPAAPLGSQQGQEEQRWSPFGRVVIRSCDPAGAVAQGLRAAARGAQARGERFPVRHLGQLAGASWTGMYVCVVGVVCEWWA